MSKKLFWALVFTLIFSHECHALRSMDQETIKEAQEYGMMHFSEELPAFAKSWCVYEDASKEGDVFGETAYLYTPYYLVAVNTRERMWDTQPVNVVDGEMLLRSYQGIFPVGLVIYLEDATNLNEKLSVIIRQGENSVSAYDMEIQDIVVVQTKLVREQVFPDVVPDSAVEQKPAAEEENRILLLPDSDKDADKDADKDKKKDDKKKKRRTRRRKASDDKANDDEPVIIPPVVRPEPVFVEKSVPSLHRVNLFVYFESGHIKLSGQTELMVILPKERERKFRFNFSSLH